MAAVIARTAGVREKTLTIVVPMFTSPVRATMSVIDDGACVPEFAEPETIIAEFLA